MAPPDAAVRVCRVRRASDGLARRAGAEQPGLLPKGRPTALPFLRDTAGLRAGQSILVNGAAGSIGSAAVQLATHFGAEVTGVCSTANTELVRSLGAVEVIDRTAEDFALQKSAYDVIFDSVGKSSFAHCRGALKPGGVYLTTEPSPAILGQTLWTKLAARRRASRSPG
jgi:NADPH:quinone reductase-like Zn-dependent oxidoreductase